MSKPVQSARHFDDRRARVYDDLIRQVVPGYDVLHKLAAVLLGDELDDAARILVAGVGTGAEIANLAPVSPHWRFTGFDPSPDMLAAAARRMADCGWNDRVALVRGSVEMLPEEAAYDAATLVLVMHFLPDDGAKLDLLRGIARRLKPEAPLILADLNGTPGTPEFAHLTAAWRAWQLAAGIPAEDVDKGFEKVVSNVHFVPEARIDALLQEAGFGPPQHFWSGLLFSGWVAWRR